MSTAAAVIIGDEILSGKVEDSNTPFLIKTLASAGVKLERVIIVRDNVDDIGQAVKDCAARYDHVFCSGGLGPTHDDRTIEAIAQAFGRPVVRHPEVVRLLHELLGERINEAALKMADVVEGTELAGPGRLPAFVLDNIFILPGVPQIFAAKLEELRPRFAGRPAVVRCVYLNVYENVIADDLARVDAELDDVQIGSYPRLDVSDHKVMVTVEAAAAEDVDRAMTRLLELLDESWVVRVDPTPG